MELAWTRLELARALAEGSPEVAIAEAKLALQNCERLEATCYADAAWVPRRGALRPLRCSRRGGAQCRLAGIPGHARRQGDQVDVGHAVPALQLPADLTGRPMGGEPTRPTGIEVPR